MGAEQTGQGVPPREERRAHLSPALGVIAAGLLACAGPVQARNPAIGYQVSLTETWTDNVAASVTEDRDADAESDFITAATAGVTAAYRGGRFTGQAGLTATSQFYANNGSRNTGYVQGNGKGSLELLQKKLVIDADGSVRRETASAFGATSVDQSLDTGNRALVRRFGIGPRASFLLGREIQGQASLRWDWTSGSQTLEGSRRRVAANASLANPEAFGPLGWNLAYSRQRTESDASNGASDSQSLRGTLIYRVSDQLGLRLIGGRESNDYESGVDRSFTNRGVGVDWVLSPRTKLNATVEKRFFGTGYNLQLAHSRPLSSFQLALGRDVSSVEDSALLSLEELAFREIFASLASTIPDPIERERVARQQAAALPNGGSTFASFVTNSFSVGRRIQFTGSLLGARNVVSLGLARSENERIGDGGGLDALDDLSRFSRIQTHSATLSWSHKLSGHSALSAGLSFNRSEGSGDSIEDVTRRSLTLGYNTRIGARTNGGLTLRRQHSTGSTSFTEHALVATLSMRF